MVSNVLYSFFIIIIYYFHSHVVYILNKIPVKLLIFFFLFSFIYLWRYYTIVVLSCCYSIGGTNAEIPDLWKWFTNSVFFWISKNMIIDEGCKYIWYTPRLFKIVLWSIGFLLNSKIFERNKINNTCFKKTLMKMKGKIISYCKGNDNVRPCLWFSFQNNIYKLVITNKPNN